MITLRQCARLAGLDLDTLMVGVAPEKRHETLLQSYRFNLHRGRAVVRRMIVRDLLRALDIGAHRMAADLFIVLRLFLSAEPQVSLASRRQASGQRAVCFGRALSRHSPALPPMRRERAAPHSSMR
jgi:hypothetical protein